MGPGKTTLLKILNGLIKPDAGSVTVRGRAQSLVSLGTGFSPILTGRENIYINAALLGIPKRQVDRQLDEIVEFAEVADFINAPVQSYSSGMKARLGFSIAVHSTPDILLVDEVLSVGDLRFRRKAQKKMLDLLDSDVSVVFVSHSVDQVQRISNRIAYLKSGKLQAIGNSNEVVLQYIRDSYDQDTNGSHAAALLMGSAKATLPDLFSVLSVVTLDNAGNRQSVFETGDDIVVQIEYMPLRPMRSLRCVIQMTTLDSSTIVASTRSEPILGNHHRQPSQKIECVFKNTPISEGVYYISATFQDQEGRLFAHPEATAFEIRVPAEELEQIGSYRSLLRLETEWNHSQ